MGSADDGEQAILDRFEASADRIAERIADATLAEVELFGDMRDVRLREEVRALARQHLDEFVAATRTGSKPSPEILDAVRERAALRARQMVPLAAQLHSYQIAQREISEGIRNAAAADTESWRCALVLLVKTFEYNIAAITALTEAYVETVQGDLAELDAARRALVDALLGGAWSAPVLTRRAVGLGFDPERRNVVVLATVEGLGDTFPPRWAVAAIARATGRPQRNTFVLARDNELIAILDAATCRDVLVRADQDVRRNNQAALRAGVGSAFTGIGGFTESYHQARRAIRHTSADRAIVVGPAEIGLFDELTSAQRDGAADLIPAAMRSALSDASLRSALEAYVEEDLNVAAAAKRLSLHPNSLRYRLARIAERTGRDPRSMPDLLELVTAARLLSPGS